MNQQSKEEPQKKKKKTDIRKWANKWLKPGELPPVLKGIGEGTVLYCPKCDLQCIRATFKDKWYCNYCGSPTTTMTKDEFAKFRESND
jgi:hypothetical protein